MTEKGLEYIHRLIPHRPPFLFVDEITRLDAQGATAVRTLRAEEPHFAGHYPNNPIMPGVLLCEAVFQTAAVYLSSKLDDAMKQGKTPVLVRIQDARFKHMVRPGDRLVIDIQWKETLQQFHFLKGSIQKDGKLVLSIEFTLALIEEKQ